ncbi:MAG: diacylglycerol/lipid kinase family protein [Limisphaerales bacterium]
MQTCIIFNPSARGQRAQALCSRLQELHPYFAVRLTAAAGDARRLAAQAVEEGFTTIVAAGGDGTANEVVNGIADVPGGLKAVRLGILPLGTVNVFARELGLPWRLDTAIKTLAAGHETCIDLGRADFGSNGQTQSRHFLQLAGAGIDSRAIELVSWELKKKLGKMAYIVAALQAAREKQPLITVQCGNKLSGELVLLGNGRFYGGSISVFPAADLRDGLLDVCVIPKLTWPRTVQVLGGLLTGSVHRWSSALCLQSPQVRLSSSSRVVLQLDGENTMELPANLTVLPKALRVVTP